ncbi:hypothetical protein B0H66DRAFT_481402 [Apodospora peruviana]|uniref:Rhodopsin domain-containing protein n=1 Tax=Apodospora peruviana TaxID=516989 RepID=A0AAE0HXT3_9PEZI|nr:hypothetical protein B0H66DRAFT_481402 [Apodospora peruviana]
MEAALAAARQFNIIIWTLYAIGVCVTIFRTYARFKQVGFSEFQADDYLIWVAVLLYSCQTTLGYEIGNLAHGLANNGMTDAERFALTPDNPEHYMRVVGSQIQVAGWTCYSTLVMVLKVAMLFFYLRLTQGLSRNYRMRVYIGFGIVMVGYLTSIIAVFASCQPFHKYWQVYPDPGHLCYPATSPTIVWAGFAANITSDVYLIVIPLPLLWGSNLRMLEKILSTIVLGAGVFVLVCAIVKTVLVVSDEANGAELAGAWGTREAFVSFVITNLPMIFPLVKAWLKPWMPALRSTNKNYKTPEGFRTIGGGNGGSGGGNGSRNKRSRGPPSANPMTNMSFADSEEQMVDEIKMQNMKNAAAVTAHAEKGQKKGHVGAGIVVSSEFEMTEDRTSTQPAAKPHEVW